MRSADPLLEFGPEFTAVQSYTLHRLDLRPAVDALRNRFHKDCIQRKIARAERESLSYESGCSPLLLNQLYGLLQRTRARHQLPSQPFEWFQNVVACMGKDVCIRVASVNDRPIAGILTLDHGSKMIYKYGGSDAQFNNLGATPWLLWQAIKEAKKLGMQTFDLGRSDLDNSGLITFKERWAATRSTLNNWRSPAMRGILSRENFNIPLAKAIYSWMPDRMVNLVGRLLYRHIG
jgi:lipid II:glycine glycyltransferase (peptidoglycan interpeptide bridge formation enzyme)